MRQVLRGAGLFDGWRLHESAALVIEDGRIAGIVPDDGTGTDLGGGLLAPGFIDLQVNGGGGALPGQGDPDAALATICAAHARLGTSGLLPTLITADRATTRGGDRGRDPRRPGRAAGVPGPPSGRPAPRSKPQGRA